MTQGAGPPRRPPHVRACLALALALAACGPRAVVSEPAPRRGEEDGGVEAPPVAACLSPEVLARIDECSGARDVTRELAFARADAAERVALARSPAALPPPTKRDYAEEARLQLTPRTLDPAEEQAVLALTGWTCRHPDDLEARFRLARLHRDHRRLEEASVHFARVVSAASAGDDLGPAAYVGWLDAVNTLGSVASRTACFDEMSATIRPVRERYCSFSLMAAHPDRVAACTRIGRISCDLERSDLILEHGRSLLPRDR